MEPNNPGRPRPPQEATLFRLMVENVRDFAIFALDLDGRVSTWNPGAEAVFGWSESEILGQDGAVLFTSEDRAAGVPAQEQMAAREKGRAEDERWHVRKDGTRFFASGVMTPILDGHLHGYAKVCRDVTDRKRAEAALRKSEERLQRMVNVDGVGVLVWALPEGRLVGANDFFLRMFGYTQADIESRTLTWRNLTPPEYIGASEMQLTGFAATGRIGPYEKEYFRKDGSREWMVFAGAALGDDTVVEYCIDVSDRKRAEAALRESEERHRKLADNLPAGFIYQIVQAPDGSRRFTYVSAGVEAVCGVTPAEVIADSIAMYGRILEDDQAQVQAAEDAADRRADGQFDCEFRIRGPGGEVRWLHCRSAPRHLEDGGSVWDGLAIDVTDRKAAEAALAEAARRKDEFMAMLAHELRNPLAPIRNALQILRLRGADTAVVEQVREMMERQVGNLGRLVDDLLDVSRITTGKVQLRRERLDLVRLARQAVSDHRSAYDRKGVSLIMSKPDTPVWVNGDPVRLAQVLDNLLTNALKFTARDGEVAVSTESNVGGTTSLSVRDCGAGIEPEMLGRLFEPFSQADRTLDRSAGGLGLGLAIVKGLAELHGGSVRAESKGLGEGSTFTVTLPAYVEPPALTSLPTTARRSAKQLRILVVEDNKDAADSLKLLLETCGYDVAVAYSGSDGVRTATEYRPEVIICDIGLPGMDGYQVAETLRGNPLTASTRLIALTGYGRDEDRLRARQAGFDEHLTKPADPAALEAILFTAG